MKLQLYDMSKKHIGEAHFKKRSGLIYIKYNDRTHYADTTIGFEDYEDYKSNMAVQDEYQLGQMTMHDLL